MVANVDSVQSLWISSSLYRLNCRYLNNCCLIIWIADTWTNASRLLGIRRPHTEHVESCRLTWLIMAKRRADYGVVLFFAYSVHAGSSSEQSETHWCWRASLLLSLLYCRLSSLCWALNCLLFVSAFILWPAVIIYPSKSLPSRVQA